MNFISCPFCNATFPAEQLQPVDGKVLCPRCGEPLPAQLVKGVPTEPVPVAEPPPRPAPPGWSNRKLGLAVLGIMLAMAAVGLVMSLLTVEWRRKNDYRTKRDTTPPPSVQAPGELSGLGFLPPDVNVVAALQVAESLKDPEGKKLLAAPRPALFDLALSTIEKWTKLKAEDLDHIVLGTEVKDKLPQVTMVVETRLPYDPTALATALLPSKPVMHRARPLYRFGLNPGEGMLWCPQSTTLVLLFRLDALKTADLEIIPLTPRQGTEAPPRAVRPILARLNKQSLAWIAGHLEDPDLVKEWLALAPLPAGQLQMVTKIRAFGLSLFSQDGLVVLGQFRTGNEKATRLLQKQLEDLKLPIVKMTVTAPPPEVTEPEAQWVTWQMRGDSQGIREVLGPVGKGK